MKKEQLEKSKRAFNALSKAVHNAGLSLKKFSEAVDSLDKAGKRESMAGESLRIQLLNEADSNEEQDIACLSQQ